MNTAELTEFEISFPDKSVPVSQLWGEVAACLSEAGHLPIEMEVSRGVGWPEHHGETGTLTLPTDLIIGYLKRNRLDGFHVHTSYSSPSTGYSTGFGQRSVSQSTFRCHVDDGSNAPRDWTMLLERVLGRWDSIGGWVIHKLYCRWQSAPFLDKYYEDRYGKAPPTISSYVEPSVDGIGPDRVRVETSLNPGRAKELLPTVNFYPSAEMWLGPHFWQYAKCTREEALAADFFIEQRDTPHYLYLKCWPTAFTRPDGEQGRMQQRLWKLFFHEDCEWPPGSGTICDKPMYGPPELMPVPHSSKPC